MILAQNREAKVNIYIKEGLFENHNSPIYNAAYYLRYYLSRITIAPFEIVEGGEGTGIYIDINPDFIDDEFSLKTENGSLYISGGKRGVIYAVWDFLESLGCRFFTPECEKIPTILDLEIPEIDKTDKPVFEYRETDYYNVTCKDMRKYMTMCRLNGACNEAGEGLGGNTKYALFVHSLVDIVPVAENFAEHPEYYALRDGKRVANADDTEWQLCLSNPGVVDVAVKNIRKILLANPDKKIVSISQNDNRNNCQCEECQKIDEAEGSPAGLMIRFANAVAEALEPEFPDVLFDILAYGYTRPASKITKPRHNVCVRLCAGTCLSHVYGECTDNRYSYVMGDGTKTLFIDDLKAWSNICDRLYAWNYTTNYPLYPMPFPNWNTLKPDLQILRDHNVKGVFEQANRSRFGCTDFNELRNYLICKLLWNPDCDIDTHRKEFLDYFYGDAAPYLDEYLKALCDNSNRLGCHVYYGTLDRYEYLNDECLAQYNELFDKAEAAVAGNGILLARVQKARMSVRFCEIYWHEIDDGRGTYNAEAINQFFTDLRAHNIIRLDEWCNLEGTYYGWVKGWDRGVYVHIPFRFQGESLI